MLTCANYARDLMYRIKEVGRLNSSENHNSNNELHQQIADNQATEYSNINSENIESDSKKMAAHEDLESSKAPEQYQSIQCATEFSNTRYNAPLATELSSKNRLKKHKQLKRRPREIKRLNQVPNGNIYHSKPSIGESDGQEPKYYINNPPRLIKNAVGSGGVEVISQSSHTVRLSISPSQGDDPGFKSRPEHYHCGHLRLNWALDLINY